VLSPLSSAGIPGVVRGPSGGYRLKRPTEEIALLEVAEGPVRVHGGAVGGCVRQPARYARGRQFPTACTGS